MRDGRRAAPGRRWSDSARRRGACLLVAGLTLLAPGAAAAAQHSAQPSAEPLWSAYPLEGRPVRPSPGTADVLVPAVPGESGLAAQPTSGPSGTVGVPLVLLVLASLVGAGLLLRRLPADAPGGRFRRSSPRPAPAAQRARSETRVLGYVSFGKLDERLGVPGPAEQEELIRERAAREGWRVTAVLSDDLRGERGGGARPGLAEALDRISRRQVGCLVVSRLDRLGRSAAQLGAIVERLGELDARLVALDYALDTSSPGGDLVTDVLIGVGAAERDRIAAGTRRGLEQARAEGRPISRPAVTDRPELQQRIATMRAAGMTLQGIADVLNAEGVPTVRGGAMWRPSSVQVAAGYKRPRSPKGRGGPGSDGRP